MNYCPYCGFSLAKPLLDGITTCDRCRRIFDSANRNKLLSAAWLARREHVYDLDILRFRSDLTEEALQFVYHYVVDLCYCHDEFLKVLDSWVDTAA
jgi:hypothetical protein